MRNLAFVGIVAVVVLVFLALFSAVRGQPQTGTALASASPTIAPRAVPASTAPVSAAPTASASPKGLYVDPKWKFSVVLPEPYRRSDRLSFDNATASRPAAADAFTARTVDEEARLATQRCETACEIWNYVAVVNVFTGTGAQSPRDFYTAFSYSRDQQLEDLTIDGHPALRVTNGPTYPRQIIVKDGDRMFTVSYGIYPANSGFSVPTGASKEKFEAILASFRFVP